MRTIRIDVDLTEMAVAALTKEWADANPGEAGAVIDYACTEMVGKHITDYISDVTRKFLMTEAGYKWAIDLMNQQPQSQVQAQPAVPQPLTPTEAAKRIASNHGRERPNKTQKMWTTAEEEYLINLYNNFGEFARVRGGMALITQEAAAKLGRTRDSIYARVSELRLAKRLT